MSETPIEAKSTASKHRPAARQTRGFRQSHRQQTPTRRAANTRFPPKPPPANTDPPRGKQRPTDLARSALVSRSLRARCALRAPRAARSGRLGRPVNRLADWENGRTNLGRHQGATRARPGCDQGATRARPGRDQGATRKQKKRPMDLSSIGRSPQHISIKNR